MKRRMMNWLGVLCGLMVAQFAWGQRIFNGTGGAIKDDKSANVYTLKISGLATSINGSFGLEKICVNIQHTWDADLDIYLVSPDGTVADLCRRNGEGDDNFLNTCFTQDAEVSINDGAAPFSGNYLPEVAFGGINNGQNPNGTWKLVIVDTEPAEESGKVNSWSLYFSNNPAKPYVMKPSKLPILMIKSQGDPVRDEPKVTVRMGIIDNGPGKTNLPTDSWNGFDGLAKMEVRGRSSQRHSKLSFALQTLDSLGQKQKAAKLLDLPKENDFVLSANHSDKSLIRNYLAYYLYGQMGHYSPRMRFVNVVMDGEYRGVYLLGEKIKRGGNRVDIAKMDENDNAGDSLTGGYIIKTDWRQGSNNDGWESKFPPMNSDENQNWLFHYPEADDITQQQRTYIQAFVDSFELACNKGLTDPRNGYPHFIDVQSFVDVMIMSELGKNVDAYWLSSFYHKDKASKGGKLTAGPIWDYDLAFGNFEYYYGYAPNGWHWEEYGVSSDKTPFFWGFLAKDPAFQNQVKCRWQELRKNLLSQERVLGLIDSLATVMDGEQQMNFEVWPILGDYIWPNPKPYERDYAGEIRRLKEWMILRMAWMDYAMPGKCN